MAKLRTFPFRVSGSEYVNRIIRMWLARYWWLTALPPAVCVGLSFYRWEWLIVALMTLSMFYSAVLALVYFHYGLTYEAVTAPGWYMVGIDDDGDIVVERLHRIPDGDCDIAVQFCVGRTRKVNYADIRRVWLREDGGITLLTGPEYRHIAIPGTAFGKYGELDNVKTALTDVLVAHAKTNSAKALNTGSTRF